LSTGDLPAWLNFDSVTTRFFGTPVIRYNGIWSIEVEAIDPYGKSAAVTFELTMPNQAPVVKSQIAPQQAQISKNFVMVMPVSLFEDPDGNGLSYYAQLLNGKPLSESGWLSFDSLKGEFSGTPSLIPFQNTPIDVEIIASDGIERNRISFRIDVGVTEVLNKISQIYLTTGIVMLVIWSLLKTLRVKKLLPDISAQLQEKKAQLQTMISQEKLLQNNVTEEMLGQMFKALIPSIMAKTESDNKIFEETMKVFLDAARVYYVYQQHGNKKSLFNMGNLWVMIDMMVEEIKQLCAGNKKDKKSAICWSKSLMELMNLMFFIEMESGRTILRDKKEKLGEDIRYLLRRVDDSSAEGLELRFNLEVINESLANMAHTDQTITEILREMAQMIAVPPYGIKLLLNLKYDFPESWYVALVYQRELGKMLMLYAKAPLDLLKLDVFEKKEDKPQDSGREYLLLEDKNQKNLKPTESADWRYIYGVLDSLVEIAKLGTSDPQIQQKIVSVLACYQNFAAFNVLRWRNVWIQIKAGEITRADLSREEIQIPNSFFSSISITLMACCSGISESTRRCGTSVAQLFANRSNQEHMLSDITNSGMQEGSATKLGFRI
jgi:hypothetical protein